MEGSLDSLGAVRHSLDTAEVVHRIQGILAVVGHLDSLAVADSQDNRKAVGTPDNQEAVRILGTLAGVHLAGPRHILEVVHSLAGALHTLVAADHSLAVEVRTPVAAGHILAVGHNLAEGRSLVHLAEVHLAHLAEGRDHTLVVVHLAHLAEDHNPVEVGPGLVASAHILDAAAVAALLVAAHKVQALLVAVRIQRFALNLAVPAHGLMWEAHQEHRTVGVRLHVGKARVSCYACACDYRANWRFCCDCGYGCNFDYDFGTAVVFGHPLISWDGRLPMVEVLHRPTSGHVDHLENAACQRKLNPLLGRAT